MATTAYKVRIAGATVEDDGYTADLGKTPPNGGYNADRKLPACPDCGGRLLPAPAGNSMCDVTCVGQPTGKTEAGVLLFDEQFGCGSKFTIDPRLNGHVTLFRRRYYYAQA